MGVYRFILTVGSCLIYFKVLSYYVPDPAVNFGLFLLIPVTIIAAILNFKETRDEPPLDKGNQED